jgi:bacterioferritin-associated ferredoxin
MTSPNRDTAPRFASPARPVRSVMIAVRVTPAEAAAIDDLARQLGAAGRCGVCRAGLDALLRERAAAAGTAEAE